LERIAREKRKEIMVYIIYNYLKLKDTAKEL